MEYDDDEDGQPFMGFQQRKKKKFNKEDAYLGIFKGDESSDDEETRWELKKNAFDAASKPTMASFVKGTEIHLPPLFHIK
jgi:hypothetical protein